MGQSWGANAAAIGPVGLNNNASVACPAATYTTALAYGYAQSPLPVYAPSPASYNGMLSGFIPVTLGATPPTALSIYFCLVSGTGLALLSVPTANLTASANLMVPLGLAFNIPTSNGGPTQWTLLVQVYPVAQAVTVPTFNNGCSVMIFPA